MGSDIRIGNRFLFPGIGYGGSCFPKDVKALKKLGNDQEQPFEIITAVDRVNTQQKKRFTSKIETHFQKNVKGKKFIKVYWDGIKLAIKLVDADAIIIKIKAKTTNKQTTEKNDNTGTLKGNNKLTIHYYDKAKTTIKQTIKKTI